jgi:hypothetical protein
VSGQSVLSPLGAALGDIDGDARDDLVFVASGVGTCGGEATSECPIRWLEVRLTGSHDASSWEDTVLITNGGRRLLDWMVGDIHNGSWESTASSGSIEVRYRGDAGVYTWSVVRAGDRWIVQNPLR